VQTPRSGMDKFELTYSSLPCSSKTAWLSPVTVCAACAALRDVSQSAFLQHSRISAVRFRGILTLAGNRFRDIGYGRTTSDYHEAKNWMDAWRRRMPNIASCYAVQPNNPHCALELDPRRNQHD
jgi:hypothetical protein